MTIQYKLIAALIAALACIATGWQTRAWYDDSRELARKEAEEKSRDLMRELAGDIATKTEQAIGGIRVENKTIFNKAVKEVVTDVIYRDCRLSPDGVLLANQARGGSAAGKPDVPLPGAKPAP